MSSTPRYPAASDDPAVAAWRRSVEASPVRVFSPTLGRVIRSGEIADQRISNLVKMLEGIDDGRFVDAAAYALVFVAEARLVLGLVNGALDDIRSELDELGVSPDELKAADHDIVRLLTLPGGAAFEPGPMWAAVEGSAARFDEFCRLGAAQEAVAEVPRLKEAWRTLHDRSVDRLSGHLNIVVSRFGEEAIHKAWVRLNEPIFESRYSQYDISRQPWSEALDGLVYITFESSRAHLVGPGRTGDCDFEDEGDRWRWTWNPCGTCGRTIRGDDIEGTPPRMKAPYEWPVLSQAYDWSWSKAGISPYGVQACIKLEQMGIDKFGYPIRVVDCPTYPDGRRTPCVRYVYKDPTRVASEYYERVGRSKTGRFGSSARTGDKA